MSSTTTDQDHLIVFEPDHPGQGVSNLLQFQQAKKRIVAFVRAVGAAVQDLEEEQFSLVVASLIGDSTPLDLLRRWAGVVGDRDADSLTRPELLKIVCGRIRANIIGTSENKANVAGFLALLEELFVPQSTVSVRMFPNGTSIIQVDIASPVLSSAGFAQRAGEILGASVPIGTLLTVHEAETLGKAFDDPNRGFDGPKFGRLLFGGFTNRR